MGGGPCRWPRFREKREGKSTSVIKRWGGRRVRFPVRVLKGSRMMPKRGAGNRVAEIG